MPFLMFTSGFYFLCSLLSVLCCGRHMLKTCNWILLFMCLLFLWNEKHQRKQFPVCSSLSSLFFSCSGRMKCESLQSFWARTEQKVIVGSPTVFAISCLPAGSLLSFWRLSLKAHETESWVLMPTLPLKCFCFSSQPPWEKCADRAAVNTSAKHTCHPSGLRPEQ